MIKVLVQARADKRHCLHVVKMLVTKFVNARLLSETTSTLFTDCGFIRTLPSIYT